MRSLLLSVLLVSVQWTWALDNFMDCPGNNKWWMLALRRCCSSDQLPKGCECFDISDKTDFTNAPLHKPKCPGDIGASFRLYNPATPTEGSAIRAGQNSITASGFDPALPTVVLVHGFTGYGGSPWMIEMRDELLKNAPTNVILLDWQNGAKGPNYFQAVANARTVGAMVGRLAFDLNQFTGASLQSIHLIGHSLGAHVVGSAGKEVNRLTGQKLGRITGLDPAGPAFEIFSANVRIDSSDAEFVDIIHTDAEKLVDAGLGIRKSVGHVDFRPNGGQHQPGCPAETQGILSLVNFEDQKDGGACSHSRAVSFFINSINKCRYNPPNGGDDCTMGFHVSTSCRGEYFPTTTDQEPFC